MATRNLSIGLLREGVAPADALVEDHNLTQVQTTSVSIPQAQIWVRERISSAPWWVNFLSIQAVAKSTGADALAFLEVNQRWMYLSFGFAHHKIKNSATSFDFGMKSAAILVNPGLLRVADSLEPNLGRRIRTQQAKDTSSKNFGIDARIALTRGIAGKPVNDLGGKIKRVSGGAHLKISTRDNIEELPEILDHILSSYLCGQIPPELQNYLSLREVEDEATLNALRLSLIASINSDDVTAISLMIPDFVVPGERDCVKFSGYGKSKVYPDIFIGSLRDYLQSNVKTGLIDEEHLDSMKLIACNDEGQDKRDHPLNKSIFFETEEGNSQSKFFLSEGVWYEVSPSLIEQLHLRLANYFLPNTYPEYTHDLTCEADYNKILAEHLPQAALMDKMDILPWTTSKIEPCDVAYLDGEALALLHVKRKTSSEDLSHLLNQGVNSWRAINSNAEVREKFLEHCEKGGLDVERVKDAIAKRRIKISYVITTHKPLDAAENNLPIFTRISADRIIAEAADLGIDVSFTYVREQRVLGNDKVAEPDDHVDDVIEE